MKKITLLLGLLCSVMAFGQTPQWPLGNALIDFSGSNPSVSTTLANNRIENAAYDQNGNLIFYVILNKIYDANDALMSSSLRPMSDITYSALIPVPGRCDEYYLIRGEPAFGLRGGKIWWQRITVQGGNYIVSAPAVIANLAINKALPTFALTEFDNAKNRRLLFCNKQVYEVTAAGISLLKTINGFVVSFSELEYFSDGGNYVFYHGNDSSQIVRHEVTPQLNLVSRTVLTTLPNFLTVKGLEIYNSGNNLLISTEDDLRVVDLSNNSVTVIPNSSAMANTNIERAVDGKLYGIHSSTVGIQIIRKLYRIDPFTMTIADMSITLNPLSGFFWFRIPHQVDGDDYLKNSFMWDLWTSDGNGDIGDEPDVLSTNIWEGDVWNCTGTIGCSTPQDPDANVNNYMTVKVQNKGCTHSDPASVHLYWTRARTGEIWPTHWTNNPSNFLNGHLAGSEVTPPSGLSIPSLAPGASVTLNVQWNPPFPSYFPASFGATTVTGKPMICFLSRIVSTDDPMHTEYNGITMADYALNNNNVATSNAALVYTGLPIMIAPTSWTEVSGLNQEVHTLLLNVPGSTVDQIQILNLGMNDLIMHGEILLYLENSLYTQWINNGAMGAGVEDLGEGVVRIIDGQNASLQGLNISAADEGNIGLQFLSTDPGLPDGTDFKYTIETIDMAGEVGSGYVFNVVSGEPQEAGKTNPQMAIEQVTPDEVVKIFPNPTAGIIQVQPMQEDITELRVRDATGKSLPVEARAVENGFEIDLREYPGGTYFIIVVTESGRTLAHRVLLEG